MCVTDAQVRKMMEEINGHGKKGFAAMKAGMDRKTARKYLKLGKLPSEIKKGERSYRTREDPFEEDWARIKTMLEVSPELQGKTLLEFIMEERPGKYDPGQIRTLQRRIKRWRATEGPEKEVFFGQEHRPGESMQMDFTNCNELGVTIAGEVFEHLLCHCVLPYSNWEWATISRSESFMALKRGVHKAVLRLGKVTKYLQSDNLSAATHDLGEGGRSFNEEYLRFVHSLGMEPRKIGIGKSNQNGDVESSHSVLKNKLDQYLHLRGSRDFESVDEYERWICSKLEKANSQRNMKVNEELSVMKELSLRGFCEHKELFVRVTRESTIRVMNNVYSVPSRLCGEKVKVHVYDERLEIFLGGAGQLVIERLLGRKKHRIDYHHIIWSLVQKPGAFARYRYREEMFPSRAFRTAYDVLCEHSGYSTKTDLEYLRILHRAASISETEVERALMEIMSGGDIPFAEKVKLLVQPESPEIPEMNPFDVNLASYDELLDETAEVIL